MEEDRELAVAVELDIRGVSCRLERDAESDYHLRVALPCDREAMWDLHGDLLEARVLRAGALVGFVPLPVPIELSDQSLAELIAVQRYEQLSTSSPVRLAGRPRPAPPQPPPWCEPPPCPAGLLAPAGHPGRPAGALPPRRPDVTDQK